MKLSQRERRMAGVGGGVALATVLVTWVLGPFWIQWTAMGDELSPKLARLDLLRERVAGKDDLLAERTRLVRELGVLCPQQPAAGPRAKKAPPRPKDAAPPKDAAAPKDAAPPKETAPTKDAAPPKEAAPTKNTAPPKGAPPRKAGADAEQKRLEAELAQLIGSNGGRIKLMVVARPAGALKGLRHFRALAFQVDLETNTQGLFKVLRALEKGKRYLRVDTLKVRHDAKKPDSVSATLQVTAYQQIKQS